MIDRIDLHVVRRLSDADLERLIEIIEREGYASALAFVNSALAPKLALVASNEGE